MLVPFSILKDDEFLILRKSFSLYLEICSRDSLISDKSDLISMFEKLSSYKFLSVSELNNCLKILIILEHALFLYPQYCETHAVNNADVKLIILKLLSYHSSVVSVNELTDFSHIQHHLYEIISDFSPQSLTPSEISVYNQLCYGLQ